MSDIAIKVEGLGKEYRIGGTQARYRTLRSSINDTFLAPFRRARSLLRGRAAVAMEETIWALKDVSFEVKFGEVVGIIGRNGAGKSTLLKILSQITEPTEGCVDMYAHVGALLEVGTGFHPELTGRENVYLNGAILGMAREEINRKFDDIVAFAEIGKFIDTPVKHYSSGMGLRLGFAVAAYLDPEILVIDEVLAVGDAAFQKKCIGKMGEVAGQGRTVLFVSHNMGAVVELCERVLWLDGGRLRTSGPSHQIVAEYLAAVTEGALLSESRDPVKITQVLVRNASGQPTTTFSPGDEIDIQIHYHADRRYEKPYLWVAIMGKNGGICGANMLLDGRCPDYIEGKGFIGVRFKSLPLLPQSYGLMMAIRDQNGNQALSERQEIGGFNVVGDVNEFGLVGERANLVASKSIPLVLPYEWYYADGTTIPVEISPAKIGIR